MLALLLLLASDARAGCDDLSVLDDLTCSSTVSGQITSSTPSELGGTGVTAYYTCGEPYAPLSQTSGEHVYAFTCEASGDVTLEVSGMDCDLDMYVLGDSCSTFADCREGSTASSTTTDAVSFACTEGETYYVVVEGYGYSAAASGSGRCRTGEGHYTLSFDVSRGTGCPEDCDNGADDDFDGRVDCDDTDCETDPVCACDADGDGHDSEACGGGDCDDADPGVNPGERETCDGVDEDCDGSVDEGATGSATWYADDDRDGYGDAGTTSRSCSPPTGYVADATDCDDASAAVHPGAEETAYEGIDQDYDGIDVHAI
ncbi:MAG: MopE-related protein, partial [Myxococcota bacterium]